MPRIFLSSIAVFSLFLSFSGCATVPPASPEFEKKARSFTPPPDRAAVYVCRPASIVGFAVIYVVSLDYADFGTLANETYLFGLVLPGEHTVKAGGGIPLHVDMIKFTADPGKNYFFSAGPGWAGISLELLSEDRGRRMVGELKQSGDNIFEFYDNSKK